MLFAFETRFKGPKVASPIGSYFPVIFASFDREIGVYSPLSTRAVDSNSLKKFISSTAVSAITNPTKTSNAEEKEGTTAHLRCLTNDPTTVSNLCVPARLKEMNDSTYLESIAF